MNDIPHIWKGPPKPPKHTCNVCGKRGEWSDNWYWYGSDADLEGGIEINGRYKPAREIIKTCSDECRQEAERQGLIPCDAEIEEDLLF